MTKQYYQHDQPIPTNDELEQPANHPRRSKSKWLILTSAFAIFVFSSFLYVQASASPLSQGLGTLPWLKTITQFVNPGQEGLVGEKEDIINIAVIGMGGEGHDGAYLADTIILVRFKPSTKQIALVSIPRDFAINLPDYGWRKINNAYAYGGPDLMMDMLSQVIGEPVPYYVTIDFEGFSSLINDLGGIDVYVERGFTDLEFPDANYEFQTVSFSQGMQHMNGDRALKFARSRHGDNGEGSDFARAARQQKIIFAVKDEVLSANTLLNPSKLLALYNNFIKYVETNIESAEMVRIAQLAQGLRQSDIERSILADGPNGLLEATIHESGAYLLIPKAGLGNYTDIRAHITSLFEIEPMIEDDALTTDTAAEQTTDPLPPPATNTPVIAPPQKVNVVILNGTTIPGYAGTLANTVNEEYFDILEIANSNDQAENTTTVYALSSDAENTLDELKKTISFETQNTLPSDLEGYVEILLGAAEFERADIVVVLGADNRALVE